MNTNTNISLFTVFAIALLTSVFSIYLYAKFVVSPPAIHEAQDQLNIVTVDSQKILQANIKSIEDRVKSGEKFTQDQLRSHGVIFATNFIKAIEVYSKDGYTVLDKKLVLTIPEANDVTLKTAMMLGVELPEDSVENELY